MGHSRDLPARRSIRLKAFDYSQAGVYFVTICTNKRRCLFGEIRGRMMHLSALGRIVRECWLEIPLHFPGLELGPYVVMPNHIHGILVFNKRPRHAVPLRDTTPKFEAFGRPVRGSLPTVIRSFKAPVSERMRGTPALRVWQRNYYERVLRSGDEFHQASPYGTLRQDSRLSASRFAVPSLPSSSPLTR
jgi:REP-associated tyrosine transposase